MKTCPWCHQPFSFWIYLTRYGSDTLLRHSPDSHPREHRCVHCHKTFWIFYDKLQFESLAWQYGLSGLAGVLILSFLLANAFGKESPGVTVLKAIILFFFFLPPSISYAKYQSMGLKQEK